MEGEMERWRGGGGVSKKHQKQEEVTVGSPVRISLVISVVFLMFFKRWWRVCVVKGRAAGGRR